MRVLLVCLTLWATSLFAQSKSDIVHLTYSFKTENILGKSIEFKYPINTAWNHQCGQYFYFYLRDQILPKYKTLVNQITQVEILYRPEENISSAFLLKEKKLQLKFSLNRAETLQSFCSYDSVNSEILATMNSVGGPVDPNPVQTPLPNPGPTDPATPLSLPSYDNKWTFNKATDYISKNEFDETALRIIRRFEWGAKKPKSDMVDMPSAKVDGVVLHNTEYSKDETVRKIQNLHMGSNRWSDIGYHYIISKYQGKWMVHEGRSLGKVGAHVGEGMNEWKIGIAIQGDYSQKGSTTHPHGYSAGAEEYRRQPEPASILVLGQLLAQLEKQYGKLPIVYSHGLGPHAANPGHTDCPGVGMLHIVEAFYKKFK